MEKTETTTQNENPKTPQDSPVKEEPKSPTTPMTTSAGSSMFSSWGGWINSAKEKSVSVLQAVKNDLEEITSAVTETFNIADPEDEEEDVDKSPQTPIKSDDDNSTTNTVNYVKHSLSSFFGSVTDALIPQLDEEDVSEAILITSDDTKLTGFAVHLAKLQSDDETYLEEPSKCTELSEKYRMWLEIVEQDQFTQQRVDKMLESSQILNEKYNKFVPDTVSHMNFFKRYLFKKALLEDEIANEERRKKEVVIEKQPEPVIIEPKIESKLPSTGLNDLELASYEMSEEEASKLLEDYEKEIKEREKSENEGEVPTSTAPPSKINPVAKSAKSNVVQSKGKNNKNVKFKQQDKSSTQQQGQKKANEKKGKNNVAEMKVEKDHFKKENESTTSDESWEKDFEM